MTLNNESTIRVILVQYEITKSWWVKYISNDTLQAIAGDYFTWKVRRNYSKLKKHLQRYEVL